MLITIMVRLVMQVRPHHLSIDVRYQRSIVQLWTGCPNVPCTTRECIILFTSLPPHIQVDSSHAFTEMTVQYLLELEWTARWVELLIMQTTPGQCWLPGPCWATSTEGSLSLNFLWFDIQQNVEQWNMATEPITFWQQLRQGWHFRQPSELVHLKMFLKWLTPFGG